jgi:hypothetical protein
MSKKYVQRNFRFIFDNPQDYTTREDYLFAEENMLNYEDNLKRLDGPVTGALARVGRGVCVSYNEDTNPTRACLYKNSRKIGTLKVTRYNGIVYNGLVLDEMHEVLHKNKLFLGEIVRFEKTGMKVRKRRLPQRSRSRSPL